jgi:hypothetical protein
MARSAHAYVRGNTGKFYEWLETTTGDLVPGGPPVWICGDCHIGNLGPLANAVGRVDIAIRDLDQTVIGNPATRSDPAGTLSCDCCPGLGSTRRNDGSNARTDDRRI